MLLEFSERGVDLFGLFLTFYLARHKKTLRGKNNLGHVNFMLVLRVFQRVSKNNLAE